MRSRRKAGATINLHVEAAEARKERMLHFAHKFLVKRGYADISLNEVLRHSGGSKATLVKYFGNKAGLFAAVFERVTAALIDEWDVENIRGAPYQVLQALGEDILCFYLRPDALAAYRAIVDEGYRHREMAIGLYRGGHALVVQVVADRLRRWHADGVLSCPDPTGDADRFTHILRSGVYEQALLGVRENRVSPQEIRDCVQASVRVFLNGLRTGS